VVGLAEALERETRTRKGPECTVGLLLAMMSKADRELLQRYLDDPTATHAGISRALRAEGHQIKDATVSRHRAGECYCSQRTDR